MTTIVTRVGKGSPLTWTEVDSNFTNLNSAKYESGNNATFGTVGGTTITASTEFSGAIGTTTPAASKFTSSSLSGNLTFTGTGNRITGDFSNGTVASRVAFQTSTTNGATRVMVIPNGTSEVSAINCTNSSDPNNASFATMQVQQSSDVRFQSAIAGTGSYLPMTFYTGGSERMRIDTSGNVGIGTSSPSFKLDVSGSGQQTVRAITTDTSGFNIARFSARYTGGGGGATSQIDIRAGDGYTYILNETNTPMLFGNNNTERMRIDSSGNVGIGTSSPLAKLQINVQDGFRFDAGASAKSYMRFGSALTGESTAELSYTRATGVTAISVGSTGSTLTDRFVIDNSGNVGIGTSSPTGKLDVVGNSSLTGSAPTYKGNIRLIDNPTGNSTNGGLEFLTSTYGSGYGWRMASIDSSGVHLTFSTRQNSASWTEAMRIDSSGRLLINTSSAFDGISIEQIDASGAARAALAIKAGSNNYCQTFFATGGSSVIGSIQASGSTTSYVTSSDYRLKENIAPMVGALETVAQLNPVTYTWKADGSDGQGFIAHELQAVVPDCVSGEKDAVDAEGNPVYQGIDTSFLVATLTAAIQELKAELDVVKAELNTLKGN